MSEQSTNKNSTREDQLREQIIGLLPRMRRFARGMARDLDRADDLVQESCERALERLDQFREGTRLDSWIYRIIYTRWIDRVRRGKTRSAHLQVVKDSGEQAFASGDFEKPVELAMDIKAALAALPEEHRAAILLVVVDGYSYIEAAAVLDVPVGTVASRVARARGVMNRLLEPKSRQNIRAASGKKGR